MNFSIDEVIIEIREKYLESHPLDIDINFLQELDNIKQKYTIKVA